ncbi:hypothetical protein V3F56_13125 [Moorellaceae bacterium AZ2]
MSIRQIFQLILPVIAFMCLSLVNPACAAISNSERSNGESVKVTYISNRTGMSLDLPGVQLIPISANSFEGYGEDRIWISSDVFDDNMANKVKEILKREGRRVYIIGPNLDANIFLREAGINKLQLLLDQGPGNDEQVVALGVEKIGNAYFIDLLRTPGEYNENEVFKSLADLTTTTPGSSSEFITQGVDQFVKVYTLRDTHTYSPYGNVAQVGEIYFQTNEIDNYKDYWYVHWFDEMESGSLAYGSTWLNLEYTHRDPMSSSYGMKLTSYGPKSSSGTSFDVTLGTGGISWTFNTSNSVDCTVSGGITSNYIQWKFSGSWGTLPDHVIFEPGDMFYTPQGGDALVRGEWTAKWKTVINTYERSGGLGALVQNPH